MQNLFFQKEIIQKMPPDVFEKEKSSIITKLNEMPKMMFSYSYRLWNEITSGQYTFLRNKKLVAHMKSFKKDAIISFYKVIYLSTLIFYFILLI